MLHALLLFAQDQAAKPGPQEGPPAWTSFMLPAMLVLIGYFVLFRPMRQQQKQQQLLIASLRKNDEVLTSGGIYGIVVSIKDKGDEVALKIDDSSPVRLRVSKSSIVRVLNRESQEEDEKDKDKDKEKDTDEAK
jgi:preprotein translocase subunit YajC